MTAVASFTLCPDVVETASRIAGVATTVETGHSRARNIVERPLRTWTLTWKNAREELVKELRRQLAYTEGGALTLEWTPPGGSATEVRLLDSRIRTSGTGPLASSVALDFEEVR